MIRIYEGFKSTQKLTPKEALASNAWGVVVLTLCLFVLSLHGLLG